MKKKPIIGISCRNLIETQVGFEGYKRTLVNEDYITSVKKVGGIPLLLPLTHTKEEAIDALSAVDGLILSGGADVNPSYWGELPKAGLGALEPERDQAEYFLLEEAIKNKMPIFAICRGLQILNVFLGGSLFQDLSYFPGDTLKHNQERHPSFKSHEIALTKDSLAFSTLKKERIWVNSFHHLVINKLSDSLKQTGSSDDGVIEMVEAHDKMNYPFLLGTQYHPEMMASQGDEDFLKLFDSFVKSCKSK